MCFYFMIIMRTFCSSLPPPIIKHSYPFLPYTRDNITVCYHRWLRLTLAVSCPLIIGCIWIICIVYTECQAPDRLLRRQVHVKTRELLWGASLRVNPEFDWGRCLVETKSFWGQVQWKCDETAVASFTMFFTDLLKVSRLKCLDLVFCYFRLSK